MRFIIVDDEEDSRINTRILTERHCPSLTFCAAVKNASEARAAIKKFEPELMFLDIEMPEETGFDLLHSLKEERPLVVFVTAYDAYAIKAIKENALDYILKPIDPEELEKLNNQIQTLMEKRKTENYKGKLSDFIEQIQKKEEDRLMLPISEGFEMIELTDMMYLQSSLNYAKVFVRDSDRYKLAVKSLKELEELLPSNRFCRIHTSYIINLEKVDKINKKDGNSVFLVNGLELPVARRRYKNLIESMRVYQESLQ